MRQIRIKSYLKLLYLVLFVLFILNKTTIRPWVLEHDFPEWTKIVVLSLPNFIEAVLGTITLTVLLVLGSYYWNKSANFITEKQVYLISATLAGVYVITQELKIHNLGGRNVYDPYDLAASVIGLGVIAVLIYGKGIFEEHPPQSLD